MEARSGKLTNRHETSTILDAISVKIVDFLAGDL